VFHCYQHRSLPALISSFRNLCQLHWRQLLSPTYNIAGQADGGADSVLAQLGAAASQVIEHAEAETRHFRSIVQLFKGAALIRSSARLRPTIGRPSISFSFRSAVFRLPRGVSCGSDTA
jgi:hypothetical protein